MRYFPVILDTLEEEKIFGGVVSVRQAVYLLIAVILSVLVFFLPVHIVIRIPFCIIFLGCGLFLAFGKITDINVDRLIYHATRYLARDKKYVLRGDD